MLADDDISGKNDFRVFRTVHKWFSFEKKNVCSAKHDPYRQSWIWTKAYAKEKDVYNKPRVNGYDSNYVESPRIQKSVLMRKLSIQQEDTTPS